MAVSKKKKLTAQPQAPSGPSASDLKTMLDVAAATGKPLQSILVAPDTAPPDASAFASALREHGQEILDSSQGVDLGDARHSDAEVRELIKNYAATDTEPASKGRRARAPVPPKALADLRHNFAVMSYARAYGSPAEDWNDTDGRGHTPHLSNPAIEKMVREEAGNAGLNPDMMVAICRVESGGDPHALNPNTKAAGLFQFIPGTAAQYALKNPFDPLENTKAAMRLMRDSLDNTETRLGRSLDATEGYVMHQQGAKGGPALITADPNSKAVDALVPVYGNRGTATSAIVGNIPDHHPLRSADITVDGFVKGVWGKVIGHAPARSGGSLAMSAGPSSVRAVYGVDFSGSDNKVSADNLQVSAPAEQAPSFHAADGRMVRVSHDLVYRKPLDPAEQQDYRAKLASFKQKRTGMDSPDLVENLKRQGLLPASVPDSASLGDKRVQKALRDFADRTGLDLPKGKISPPQLTPAIHAALDVYGKRVNRYADLQRQQFSARSNGLDLGAMTELPVKGVKRSHRSVIEDENAERARLRAAHREEIIELKQTLAKRGLYQPETAVERERVALPTKKGRKPRYQVETRRVEKPFDEKVDGKLIAAIREAQTQHGLVVMPASGGVVDSLTMQALTGGRIDPAAASAPSSPQNDSHSPERGKGFLGSLLSLFGGSRDEPAADSGPTTHFNAKTRSPPEQERVDMSRLHQSQLGSPADLGTHGATPATGRPKPKPQPPVNSFLS